MSKRHVLFLLTACVLFVFFFNPNPLYFLSDDWDSLLFSLQPFHILHSFRPLSDASLWLDHAIWNMNGIGFHLTNYILHFACVFCVYHFFKQLLLVQYSDEFASGLSLTGSLLFLYYPFHSEAIFWIVGRGAVLCTLTGLLCLIFFIKKKKRVFYYPLSILFFAAALLSYEEAWILPVLITLFAIIDRDLRKKKRILQVVLFWVVFFFYLIGRFYFTQNIIGTPYGSERLLNFNVFFLARNLAAFFFRSFIIPLQSSVAFASLCVVLSLLLLVLLFRYRKKINFIFALGVIFFLLTLLPVLPLGIDTHDTESERFLYFPSVFFILAIIQLFAIIFNKNYQAVYLLGLVALIPFWLSYNSFVMSSLITKKTVSAVQQISYADTLFCLQLPGQYKGAFIFRNGFKNMVRLEKGNTIKNVVILSTSELFQPSKNYTLLWKRSSKNDSLDNQLISWTERNVIIQK